MPVSDPGIYRRVVAARAPDQRPMFDRLDGDRVIWSDGASERVDTVILATGYRPDLDYLRALGALDGHGLPVQSKGMSRTVRGLGFVGLEWQRSFCSASLGGVGRDARYVVSALQSLVEPTQTSTQVT